MYRRDLNHELVPLVSAASTVSCAFADERHNVAIRDYADDMDQTLPLT